MLGRYFRETVIDLASNDVVETEIERNVNK